MSTKLVGEKRESEIQYEIKRIKNQQIERNERSIISRKALLDGGWVEGVHFVDTTKWETKELSYSIGNWYDESKETLSGTFKVHSGSITPILYKEVEGELVKKPAEYEHLFADVERRRAFSKNPPKPKFVCSYITTNRRKYSAKTLLEQLEWKNNRIKGEFEQNNVIETRLKNSLEFLTRNYPSAEVTVVDIYKYRRYIKGVKVEFPNGNYMELIPTSVVGEENVEKTYVKELEENNTRFKVGEFLKL